MESVIKIYIYIYIYMYIYIYILIAYTFGNDLSNAANINY